MTTKRSIEKMGYPITPKEMNRAIHNAQKKINAFYSACDNDNDKETIIASANDAINALIFASNTQSDYSNQLISLNANLAEALHSNG